MALIKSNPIPASSMMPGDLVLLVDSNASVPGVPALSRLFPHAIGRIGVNNSGQRTIKMHSYMPEELKVFEPTLGSNAMVERLNVDSDVDLIPLAINYLMTLKSLADRHSSSPDEAVRAQMLRAIFHQEVPRLKGILDQAGLTVVEEKQIETTTKIRMYLTDRPGDLQVVASNPNTIIFELEPEKNSEKALGVVDSVKLADALFTTKQVRTPTPETNQGSAPVQELSPFMQRFVNPEIALDADDFDVDETGPRPGQ